MSFHRPCGDFQPTVEVYLCWLFLQLYPFLFFSLLIFFRCWFLVLDQNTVGLCLVWVFRWSRFLQPRARFDRRFVLTASSAECLVYARIWFVCGWLIAAMTGNLFVWSCHLVICVRVMGICSLSGKRQQRIWLCFLFWLFVDSYQLGKCPSERRVASELWSFVSVLTFSWD